MGYKYLMCTVKNMLTKHVLHIRLSPGHQGGSLVMGTGRERVLGGFGWRYNLVQAVTWVDQESSKEARVNVGSPRER